MSVRLRRLQSDYEQLQDRFRSSPFIVIRRAVGNPPERYEIEYRVKGLVLQNDGRIVESVSHVAEIVLTRAYPHRAPYCKMLTPIFHPNISPGAICIGDHWAASESLSDLIIRIGQMITYQAHNTKSPLNGEAARWTDENSHLLPVDSSDLIPPETAPAPAPPVIRPPEAEPGIEQCQNCGASSSSEARLIRCVSGHVACRDCVIRCEKCGATLCLLCKVESCAVCGAKGCFKCFTVCSTCGSTVCPEHVVCCAKCGKPCCHKCGSTCPDCGRTLCKDDLIVCHSCHRPLCSDCSAKCARCAPDVRHHRSDLAKCERCGAQVCHDHLHTSVVLGVSFCDKCGTPCASCRRWVVDSELASCSVCGVLICPYCTATCRVCGKLVCPSHSITCHACGRTVCRGHAYTCPTCGKAVCRTRSHLARCAICGKLVCSMCLKTCPDCKTTACPDHIFRCPVCAAEVCSKCVDTCSVCKTQHHRTHLVKCGLCGRKLCRSCARICSHCKGTVCPQETVQYSRRETLCVPCFDRKEKKVALVVISAFVGGLLLLGLIGYLLLR